jgi:NAD(P)-dependent dehydrogenase (short-subunit alcohol dehydrogenase family)
MNFKGRKAVVTGGGSGQGNAICLALAKEGIDIAVLDLSTENANRAATQIRELKRNALAAGIDVSDYRAVGEYLNLVHTEFGRIDFLVNAAGFGQYVSFAEMTEDIWDRSIATHLKGVFNCCRHVINYMIDQRYGRIVSISSVSGISGSPRHVQYSAAKAGVIGFTKALAKEIAPHGITVNAIAPGAIDTPYLDAIRNEAPELLEMNVKATPVGRLGTPEEIAALCLFLISDEASYITGQTINISGGWVT